MQLCLLKKYLGKVRIFQAATRKYLDNKKFFEPINFAGQSF